MSDLPCCKRCGRDTVVVSWSNHIYPASLTCRNCNYNWRGADADEADRKGSARSKSNAAFYREHGRFPGEPQP